jgi:HD-GYP domain-containing protein (c-di-GMP phosphodiesterase class II)
MVEDSTSFLEDTIAAFRRMVENKSHTKTIERLVELTVKTSRKMGLDEKEVGVIQYVAAVHDIGMTEVSDDILNKTLNLTSEEIRQIREHPQRGAELIRPLEFIESVSNIILYHHERVDGRGYPMGLRGEQIPIGARIISVIDAFQAITVEKPYRSSQSTEKAMLELIENAGSQFDPDVVDAFIRVLKEEGMLSGNQEREFQRLLHEVVAGVIRG